MKIQCDVCDKDEALVFCVADEAALCNACDHRVHHANKLAGKHQRFSLIQPSAKQAPLCDICQERRAFLFCQQDRAILCRECDLPIHKVNEHTQKHNRFLLTGVKLSANSSLYSSLSSSSSPAEAASSANSLNNLCDGVPNIQSQNSTYRPASANHTISKNLNPRTMMSKATTATPSTITAAAPASTDDKGTTIHGQMMNEGGASVPTSSISDYLIEMLPGWHVEDFLGPSSPFGFCKSTGDNDMIPLWDADIERNPSSFSADSTGVWVPKLHLLYNLLKFNRFPLQTWLLVGKSASKCPKTSQTSSLAESGEKTILLPCQRSTHLPLPAPRDIEHYGRSVRHQESNPIFLNYETVRFGHSAIFDKNSARGKSSFSSLPNCFGPYILC